MRAPPWAVVLLFTAGAAAADHKLPPWREHSRMGQDLYRENCAVCHDIKTRSRREKSGRV